MRKFAVFMLSLFHLTLWAKQSDIRGVSIAEDTLPPNQYAILDVRSINKGVKFPTVNYESLDEISSGLSVEDKGVIDGLMLFVNSASDATLGNSGSFKSLDDLRGYYYFDSSIDKWVKLEPINVIYPVGSIIMFSGHEISKYFDLNTGAGKGPEKENAPDYSDWHICDGSTVGGIVLPNLQGMFVVGADPEVSDYDTYMKTGGNNKKLMNAHFPNHKHSVDMQVVSAGITVSELSDHVHNYTIKKPMHNHHYVTTNKEGAGRAAAEAHRDQKWTMDVHRWGVSIDKKTFDNDPFIDPNSQQVKVSKTGSNVKVSIPSTIFNENSTPDVVDPVDLRPPYYVVVYAMRVSYSGTYPVDNYKEYTDLNDDDYIKNQIKGCDALFAPRSDD